MPPQPRDTDEILGIQNSIEKPCNRYGAIKLRELCRTWPQVIRSNKGPGRIPKADYLKTLCQAAHRMKTQHLTNGSKMQSVTDLAAHNLSQHYRMEDCAVHTCKNSMKKTAYPEKIDYVNVLLSAAQKEQTQMSRSLRGIVKKRRVSISDNEEHEASVKRPRLTICIPPPPHNALSSSIITQNDIAVKRLRLTLPPLRLEGDWRPMREIEHTIGPSDNVDLHAIATAFGLSKGCKVIDPKNHRPFYEYTPGYLEAADMEDMIKDGHLGIIGFAPTDVKWMEKKKKKWLQIEWQGSDLLFVGPDSRHHRSWNCLRRILFNGMRRDDGDGWIDYVADSPAIQRGDQDESMQDESMQDEIEAILYPELALRDAETSIDRRSFEYTCAGRVYSMRRIFLLPFLHLVWSQPSHVEMVQGPYRCSSGGLEISSSSSWNREVIFLLTAEFLDEIKSDKHPPIEYDSVAMSMDRMVKTCTQKLQRTRDIYVLQLRDPPKFRVGNREGGKGQKNCKTTWGEFVLIAVMMSLTAQETYNQRAVIIERCQPQDPEQWGAIKEIHRLLQVGGMSSDETETEGLTQSRGKRVRRVAIRWLNPELALMWKAVESYDVPFGTQLFPKRGNKSYSGLCLFED
ncbi:hypothetical protein A0H81_09018 [Grifola frondosa]|uniref:Uncharacterized protein n=1 Tax=Grifola frondosa TaxID=5627 RepID=A0A1C7M648_GRIFR|nr:hypothetical protein A0H81_09018 [Grifola frondosa]